MKDKNKKQTKQKVHSRRNNLKDLCLLKKLNSWLKNHPTKKIPDFRGLTGRFNQIW